MISSKEKALAILAYFGPLFLLAVLLAPESRYIPLIGWTFQLLNIFIVILFFLGLSHAIREAEEPLPFIGGIEILK